MELKIRKYFSGKETPKSIKFAYDKTSKRRPAWIWVENLPKNVMFLSTKVNGKIHHYRVHLSTTIPLFLPTNYTKEEMRKFYDKFAPIYNKEVESRNFPAARFLLQRVNIDKNARILDLGAGSGISSLPFVKQGYNNITLVDYSPKMLAEAKKRNGLKRCTFICSDMAKLKLKEKYGLVFSVFSFASNSYFTDKEMVSLWKKISSILERNGLLMMIGNDFEPPRKLFKKIKSGKYEIIQGYKAQWYVGRKK